MNGATPGAGEPVPNEEAKGVRDAALSRRSLLAGAAGVVGGALVASMPGVVAGQGAGASAPVSPVPAADPTSMLGLPTSAVGARAPFESPARTPVGQVTGSSRSPLRELTGTITPSDLHFERHHAGVPTLDPATHRLLIHGMVDRPTTFTVDDIKRFPQVTRVHFIECSGNGRATFRDP